MYPCKIFGGITRDARTGGGGGQKGQLPPPMPFAKRGKGGAKVPFKYKEYYITVSFQGAFS